MKNRIVIITLIAFILIFTTSCNSKDDVAPVGSDNIQGIASIDTEELCPYSSISCDLSFDNGVCMVFAFCVDSEDYDAITALGAEPRILGSVNLGGETVIDGRPLAPEPPQSEAEPYVFALRLDDIPIENYFLEYTADAVLAFSLDGESYRIPLESELASVYSVALQDYSDRRQEQSGAYKYQTSDGDYSPFADLTDHHSLLCSVLCLELTDGVLLDSAESSAFSSIYEAQWFDDILTVRMKNGGDVSPNVLRGIYLNGRPVYFEIYQGVVKVVTEGYLD